MYQKTIEFIKSLYPNQNPVTLHAPIFLGKEKEYLTDCIDSTFVSYVGKYVTKFEELTAKYTGAKYAVAVVNGTAALRVALQIAGVKYGDEVVTQPLTFVATANAISHCGAKQVFIDVDLDTMGMSPEKLEHWLKHNTKPSQHSQPNAQPINKLTNLERSGNPDLAGQPINKVTGKKISAIVPMHTFGQPCRIDEIVKIANEYNIPVIEDAAESLGSFYKQKHTGTFGVAGIISYNGNKTITTGGGGMIITDDEEFAKRAKHITTTAKVPHKWEYVHDEVAYNYRLTNLNAAIGVAQMEYFDLILANKRETANKYNQFFSTLASTLTSTSTSTLTFKTEPSNAISNYWLNVVQLNDRTARDKFLEETNNNGVMTRPIWRLMNKLVMYKACQTGNLDNANWLVERVVNLPSGVRN